MLFGSNLHESHVVVRMHLDSGRKQRMTDTKDSPNHSDSGSLHQLWSGLEPKVQVPFRRGRQLLTLADGQGGNTYMSFTPLSLEGR